MRVSFERLGDAEFAFRLGSYDRGRNLVIDPVLGYSTYLGGFSLLDAPARIVTDRDGNLYVAGTTQSIDYPTINAIWSSSPGLNNIFISKISADGSRLLHSTYISASGNSFGDGIALDPAGGIYVTGTTDSLRFPTTEGSFQRNTLDTCCTDAVAMKLSPDGGRLIYSTFLAGNRADDAAAVAADSAGNAYVLGSTASSDFPTTPGTYQRALAGARNLFITKLNPTGSAQVYGTLLGGRSEDIAYDIAVDSTGAAYVTGSTNSNEFPTTSNAIARGTSGGRDILVSKISPDGTQLVYSTLLGASGNDIGRSISVDSIGAAFVAGTTTSTTLPVTPNAAQRVSGGGDEAFALKLRPSGGAIEYMTYLGGSGSESDVVGRSDGNGNFWVTGTTTSSNLVTTADALQKDYRGNADGFAIRLNQAGTAFTYSSYVGGPGADILTAVTVDARDNVYLGGITSSTGLASPAALQTVVRGAADGFYMKLDFATPPPPSSLTIISGNNQSGTAGALAANPLVIEVRSTAGPAADVPVTFAATNGGVSPTTARTDVNGRASVRFTFGSSTGAATVTATVAGLPAATFNFTVSPPPVVNIEFPVSIASGASYTTVLAADMIAAIYGERLASQVVVAPTGQTPETLDRVRVRVIDSTGRSRPAGLFFVSPQQTNILIPAGTAAGTARLEVDTTDGRLGRVNFTVSPVAPGIFSPNGDGQGPPSAVLTTVNPDGVRADVLVFAPNASTGKFGLVPLNLGPPGTQAVLTIYTTGFRGRTSLAGVTARIGDVPCDVLYAGAQGQFPGLDQVNITVPSTLADRGELPLVISVDGRAANTMLLSFGPAR